MRLYIRTSAPGKVFTVDLFQSTQLSVTPASCSHKFSSCLHSQKPSSQRPPKLPEAIRGSFEGTRHRRNEGATCTLLWALLSQLKFLGQPILAYILCKLKTTFFCKRNTHHQELNKLFPEGRSLENRDLNPNVLVFFSYLKHHSSTFGHLVLHHVETESHRSGERRDNFGHLKETQIRLG